MAGASTVHITNAWHPTSGGIGTFYRNLLQHAETVGRQMTLIVPGESTRVEQRTASTRVVYVQAALSGIAGGGYRTMWPWGRQGKLILRALQDAQPDLIEISDKYGLAALGGFIQAGWCPGLRLRPVLLGVSHERMQDNIGLYLSLPGAVGRFLCNAYLKRAYWLMFDHHAANSEYTASELLAAARDHRVHRWMHVMPMGVDTHRFEPMARNAGAREWLAERCGCPLSARLLLYAGRLAREKNIPLLVETLAALDPQYHLTVAGDGNMRNWFQTAGNSRAPGRIHFAGHLAAGDLSHMLAGADAFLHPNGAEPFGIAPLEAMAAGTPVVLPRSGGVLSYASDENAWLAEPNGHSFARTVEELFSREDLRISRSAAARRTSLLFDWAVVAARWFSLYDAIAAGVPVPWTISGVIVNRSVSRNKIYPA